MKFRLALANTKFLTGSANPIDAYRHTLELLTFPAISHNFKPVFND